MASGSIEETESTVDESEARFDGAESCLGEESDVDDDFSSVSSKRSTSKPTATNKSKFEPTRKDKADLLMDKAINILDNNKKAPTVEDEDDTYCKHLAFQLKGLTRLGEEIRQI